MNLISVTVSTSIETYYSREKLVEWYLEEKLPENIELRFGGDFGPDYYDILEKIWTDAPEKYPLIVVKSGDQYMINDGWHRFAISIMRKQEYIPCEVKEDKSIK